MDIEAVAQEKIDNDADFQATLVDLPDEDKEVAINEKKREIIKNEFESLNKKAQENEQKFKDQQARAKKAEEDVKKAKETKAVTESKDLSQADIIYVAKADIHEEDINEVIEYAKLRGIPVKEAHDFFKPILEQRMAERRTALATQTKGGHGSSKLNPDTLINKAKEGALPEEDIDKLAEAQMQKRLARSQG